MDRFNLTEPPQAAFTRGHKERTRLIRKIMDQFTESGYTDWGAAWRAHPEWKVMLGANNKTGLHRVYRAAHNIRHPNGHTPNFRRAHRMRIKGRAAARMAETSHTHSAAQPDPVPAQPEPVAVLQFCPRCGLNIGMYQTAFAIAVKHSPQ